MYRRGLRLAVGVNLQRKQHPGLSAPCVDRAAHHPHEVHVSAGHTHAPCGKRGVSFRVGRLFGRKGQGDGLRHIGNKSVQKQPKLQINPQTPFSSQKNYLPLSQSADMV